MMPDKSQLSFFLNDRGSVSETIRLGEEKTSRRLTVLKISALFDDEQLGRQEPHVSFCGDA
jgi:hypothetical protein